MPKVREPETVTVHKTLSMAHVTVAIVAAILAAKGEDDTSAVTHALALTDAVDAALTSEEEVED
jgi:hypothetical protein